MGRPPGARNVTGMQGGTKNGTKPVGGGKNGLKSSTPSSTTNANKGEKEKTPQDRSQCNFPYDIRLNSYASLHNAVTKGTPRIKRILTEECDFIIECRVCRNLFRSLPNFITHKINYCKKAFDSTWCIGLSSLIETGTVPTTSFNVEYEVDPELVFVNDQNSSEPSETRTRSVAELYNEIAERTEAQKQSLSSADSQSTSSDHKNNVVRLQVKPLVITGQPSSSCNVVRGGGMNSVVVQQRLASEDPSNCDNYCTKPARLFKKDTAILGPDGKVICTAPAKGIEQVVRRLTAQLKALEEKEAQKITALATGTLICDICKTVFDSDKALRQHKRESLDCGKIWGFKFPIAPEKSPVKTSNLSNTTAQAAKDDAETSNQQKEVLASTRRIISPIKGRRVSHPLNGVISTKRNLPLSPAMKIKMKYIKLDSSSSTTSFKEHGVGGALYSCSRCSSSFGTKHEMSMHLALCTGVINYAYTRESEPPQEKIRISLRNDFSKTPVPAAFASPMNSIVSESHEIGRHVSGASLILSNTPTAEVNNNKQPKTNYLQHASSRVSVSSSSEEDDSQQRESAIKVGSLLTVEPKEVEPEGDSEHDSGVSSSSSSNKKPKLLLEPAKKPKTIKSKSTFSTTSKKATGCSSSAASEATKLGGSGDMLSERLDPKNTVKSVAVSTLKGKKLPNRSTPTLNLRKAIQSRIRKSRRIPNPPPQLTKTGGPLQK